MAGTQLAHGQQLALLSETNGRGTVYRNFSIQSDAILAGLVVHSLTGTITVNIYSILDGQQSLLMTVGTLLAPTESPSISHSATTTATLKAEVIISADGTADYQLDVRAIGTNTVSIAELPLPPLAATSTNQSDSNLLLHELRMEFEEVNKNLRLVIKQLSLITDQEEDDMED